MFQSYKDWIESKSDELKESCSTYEDWMKGLYVDDHDEADIKIDKCFCYVEYLLDDKNSDIIPVEVVDIIKKITEEIKKQAICNKVCIHVAPKGYDGEGEYIEYEERLKECNIPQYVREFAEKTRCYLGIIYAIAIMVEISDEKIYFCRLQQMEAGCDYIADNMTIFTANLEYLKEYIETSIANDYYWSTGVRTINYIGDEEAEYSTNRQVYEVVDYYLNNNIRKLILDLSDDFRTNYNWEDKNAIENIFNIIMKKQLIGILENEEIISTLVNELHEFNKDNDIVISFESGNYARKFMKVPYYFGRMVFMLESIEGEWFTSVLMGVLLKIYENRYKVNYEVTKDEDSLRGVYDVRTYKALNGINEIN